MAQLRQLVHPEAAGTDVAPVGIGSDRDGATIDVSDAELEAQALAADPDGAPADDAVSLWEREGTDRDGLLPGWYLPVAPTGSRRLQGWRRRLAWLVIATFLVIDAAGLCSTYGPLIFHR